MTFRAFVDRQLAELRRQRPAGRDGDWPPLAVFEHGSGFVEAGRIPWAFFNDRATKDALIRDAVVPHARRVRARKVALVVTMFTLSNEHPAFAAVESQEEAEEVASRLPRFQDIEGSVEVLSVLAFDQEIMEMWQAPIDRSGARPKLGEWRQPGRGMDWSGDLIDPIREAMR